LEYNVSIPFLQTSDSFEPEPPRKAIAFTVDLNPKRTSSELASQFQFPDKNVGSRNDADESESTSSLSSMISLIEPSLNADGIAFAPDSNPQDVAAVAMRWLISQRQVCTSFLCFIGRYGLIFEFDSHSVAVEATRRMAQHAALVSHHQVGR
jgi:hypothetical protein